MPTHSGTFFKNRKQLNRAIEEKSHLGQFLRLEGLVGEGEYEGKDLTHLLPHGHGLLGQPGP